MHFKLENSSTYHKAHENKYAIELITTSFKWCQINSLKGANGSNSCLTGLLITVLTCHSYLLHDFTCNWTQNFLGVQLPMKLGV